ncbi:NYN domain-containing protein [Candidatus Babeliales bacterium]|nr:NYN domain-containing protein [Candidatus Babeliales bacterium]
MIVLVDGYNVMKMVFSCRGQQFRMEKRKFICEIGKYFKIKSETVSQVILFFDGGLSMHMMREVKNGVVVMHSGQRMSADDVIIEYVEKKKNKEFLLVTNDRGLIKLSHQAGKYVVCMDSDAFWELVCKTVIMDKQTTQSASGLSGEIKKIDHGDESVSNELDALMMIASVNLPDKDENEHSTRDALHKRRKKGTAASVIKKI